MVRYLSSLDGESSDPVGARLVSHLSHCASNLEPVLLQSPPASALPFPPWPWASFPQISPNSPASSSGPFPRGRRDLALLGGYPSPATLRLGPLAGCHQGVPPLLAPTALATVHRLPSLAASPVLAPSRPTQSSPHSATGASPLPLPNPSSSSSSSSKDSDAAELGETSACGSVNVNITVNLPASHFSRLKQRRPPSSKLGCFFFLFAFQPRNLLVRVRGRWGGGREAEAGARGQGLLRVYAAPRAGRSARPSGEPRRHRRTAVCLPGRPRLSAGASDHVLTSATVIPLRHATHNRTYSYIII